MPPNITNSDPEYEQPEYHERYCGFIDILGFRGLIDRLSRDGSQFEDLRELLRAVHPPIGTVKTKSGVRIQSISDALALSAEVSASGLIGMFRGLEHLCLNLLCQGYFVRGAIVKGPLYHDDQMVFGEALVRAHQLESTVARFPRIMVTREVTEDVIKYRAARSPHLAGVSDILRHADDGPAYLHILNRVVELIKKNAVPYSKLSDEESADYTSYKAIGIKIQQRFEESVDTPEHFEKVKWFAQYWNEVIPRTESIRVHGPGLDRKLKDY